MKPFRPSMLQTFQVSLAVLLAFTGIVLATSEEGPIPALTGALALGSLYFVDWKRTWCLGQGWLTGLALAAFAAAGVELLLGGLEAPLVAACHLLVYLSWVLLFSRKQELVYWFLLVLTILEISLAMFLNSQYWVGLGLLAYVLLAIWTLSVFLLYRSLFSRQFSRGIEGVEKAQHSQIQSFSGVARHRGQRTLSGSFLRSNAVLAGLSLFAAAAMFLLIPRFWVSAAIPGDDETGEPLTGFTRNVKLGDLGEILESSAPMMIVELFHTASKKPLTAEEYAAFFGPVPLFRGASQSRYSEGYWRRLSDQVNEPTTPRVLGTGTVKQRFVLHDLGNTLLFTFGDVRSVYVEGRLSARRQQLSDEFVLSRPLGNQDRIIYSVQSTPEVADTSRRSIRELLASARNPEESPVGIDSTLYVGFTERWNQYLSACKEPDSRLARTADLTRTITSGSLSSTVAADRILKYLQDDKRFQYSMKLAVIDPQADPIEDFLFNRKEGHCEYFASAMVMMLRFAGIPARLVTGFKGGVYSEETNAFHVQQLHAHAWVEAFLDKQWVTFDPTPDARDLSVQQQQSAEPASPSSGLQLWTLLIKFSRFDQYQLIYEPLQKLALSVVGVIRELLEGRGSWLQRLWSFITTPERWFSLDGLILLMTVSALVMLARWMLRRFLRMKKLLGELLGQSGDGGAGSRMLVPYFERLLAIAGSHGLERGPSQTAREFVNQLLNRWPIPETATVSVSHADLAETFNKVRFGGQALDEKQASRLEAWLDEFEQRLTELRPSTVSGSRR